MKVRKNQIRPNHAKKGDIAEPQAPGRQAPDLRGSQISGKKKVEIVIVSYWTQEEIDEYKKAFTDELRVVYVWTKLKKGDKVRLIQESGK